MFAIVRDPIDVPGLLAAVADPAAGAVELFLGVVRNHSGGRAVNHLVYDVYEPMAVRQMEAMAADIRARWELRHLSMVHRVGRLAIGEVSVAIAVSSDHRGEAFAACRCAIDTLKKEVPIWKKEVFEDGEVWIEGAPPAASDADRTAATP